MLFFYETILISVLDCFTLIRLPLLLSVFALVDFHVCLSVCYFFIFMLYLVYDYINNDINIKI